MQGPAGKEDRNGGRLRALPGPWQGPFHWDQLWLQGCLGSLQFERHLLCCLPHISTHRKLARTSGRTLSPLQLEASGGKGQALEKEGELELGPQKAFERGKGSMADSPFEG